MTLTKGMLGDMYGMPVIESPFATTPKQFRYPRSKGKRIHKKFRKNKANWKQVPGIFIMMGKVLIHPQYRQTLLAEIERSRVWR